MSVKKDLVLILDTGTFMSTTEFGLILGNPSYALDLATRLAKSIMQTLAADDRVTILPVNESASPVLDNVDKFQFSVPAHGLDVADPGFQKLLEALGSEPFSGNLESNSGELHSSNFSTAFHQARSVFESPDAPSQALQIVILLTGGEGNVPSQEDIGTAKVVFHNATDGPRLFVYELGNTSGSQWRDFCCEAGGFNEKLNPFFVLMDPLSQLTSYFGFLVRCRNVNTNGVLHFWQPNYVDALTSLGRITTVAYPVMAADGHFIGVAGVSLQIDGLGQVLKGQILTRLVDLQQSLPYERGVEMSECYEEYKVSQTDCDDPTDHASNALCRSDVAATYETLTCCGQCRGTPPSRSKNQKVLWLSSATVGSVILLLAATLWIVCWIRRPRRRQAAKQDISSFTLYSYKELSAATNGFDTANVIGRGAYGVVFRGILRDEEVAIKQMAQQTDLGADEFQAELKILGITRHPNLVELKGACFQPATCFLVYELVEGGDLFSWLWPTDKDNAGDEGSARFLTWTQRVEIARGTAESLLYLHDGLMPKGRVFHLDVKPQNILLDKDLCPKLADFGISQIYEPGYTLRVVPVREGTLGYVAPEVFHGQNPNSKLDVYSYGVVLLQLVSGRKINDPQTKPFLLIWARRQVEAGHTVRIIDEVLLKTSRDRATFVHNCTILIDLALQCLMENPDLRPEMSEVLDKLDSLLPLVDRKQWPAAGSKSGSEESVLVSSDTLDVVGLISRSSSPSRSPAVGEIEKSRRRAARFLYYGSPTQERPRNDDDSDRFSIHNG